MTDLIRLNEKGIRVYNSTGGSKRAANVCWAGRLGKLVKYSKNRSIAYVIWDGNRSFERVSVELIEPCGIAAE